MNYRDAMTAIVQGDWVRHDAMQPGVYIAHSFQHGPMINFPSGSSSGWSPRDSDLNAEWSVCGPEELKRDGWGQPLVEGEITVYFPNVTSKEVAARRAATPKLADMLIQVDGPDGPWVRATADLPPGHYNAKFDPAPDNVGKWGKPVERDKWGRLTNAPD